RRRHTRFSRDWSSDVCSSDLRTGAEGSRAIAVAAARTEHRLICWPIRKLGFDRYAHRGSVRRLTTLVAVVLACGTTDASLKVMSHAQTNRAFSGGRKGDLVLGESGKVGVVLVFKNARDAHVCAERSAGFIKRFF